jgi:hypothetical protein
MFKLASLFVDISARDDAMRKQVGALKGELSAMGVAIGTAVGQIAAGAISKATSAISGFFARGISGATNLAETVSKVNAIFGESAGSMIAQADSLSKAFGLPKQQMLDAAANIGEIAKGAGQSEAQAASLANAMSKLAADASSFHNVPMDVALEKIRAGLTGEAEPLRSFGVLLNEDAVAAEALALGLAKNKREIDDSAKVAARASLIQKGLVDAQGDLERTAGSTANQWRKFTGTLENTAVSIGESLAPAIQAVVGSLADTGAALAAWVEESKSTIQGWAESFAAAIRAVPDAWDTFKAGLAVAFLKVEEWSTNVMAVFETIPGNLGIIGSYIANNWSKLVVDGVKAVATAFFNLGENLYELGASVVKFLKNPTQGFEFNWKPLLEGFHATADKLPELIKPNLVSMTDQINAVGAELNDKIQARAKAAEEAAKKAAEPAKKAAAQATKKSADFRSETSSVSEFALKLRSSIYEGETPQVKEQKETNKQLSKANQTLEKMTQQVHLAVMG